MINGSSVTTKPGYNPYFVNIDYSISGIHLHIVLFSQRRRRIEKVAIRGPHIERGLPNVASSKAMTSSKEEILKHRGLKEDLDLGTYKWSKNLRKHFPPSEDKDVTKNDTD